MSHLPQLTFLAFVLEKILKNISSPENGTKIAHLTTTSRLQSLSTFIPQHNLSKNDFFGPCLTHESLRRHPPPPDEQPDCAPAALDQLDRLPVGHVLGVAAVHLHDPAQKKKKNTSVSRIFLREKNWRKKIPVSHPQPPVGGRGAIRRYSQHEEGHGPDETTNNLIIIFF